MIIAIIPASKLPGYLVVWRSYSKWRLAIWFGVISKEERSNTRCTRCKRSCQDSESNPNPNPTLGSSTAFLTTWLPWHRWKNWPFIDYMFLYMHVSVHIFEYYCATQPGNLDAGMMAMIISVAFDIWSFFSRGCVDCWGGARGGGLGDRALHILSPRPRPCAPPQQSSRGGETKPCLRRQETRLEDEVAPPPPPPPSLQSLSSRVRLYTSKCIVQLISLIHWVYSFKFLSVLTKCCK